MTVIHAAPMPLPRVGLKRLGQNPVVEIPYFSGAWPRRPGLGNARAPYYGATRLSGRLGAGSEVYAAPNGPYIAPQMFPRSPHHPPYYGSYGGFLIQAGLGRYGRMQAQPSPVRRMRGYARLGSCGGYPKRLGQNWWNDLTSLFTPVPGGGSGTVHGQTTYVDSSGNPSATYDPVAGSSNPLTIAANDASGLASAAVSSIGSALPWWGWALIVGGGGLLVYRGLK
jgi:hypothetical protein